MMTISNNYYGLMGQAVEEAIKYQFPLLVPDEYTKEAVLRAIEDKGFETEDIQIILPKEAKKDEIYIVFEPKAIVEEILGILSFDSFAYTYG